MLNTRLNGTMRLYTWIISAGALFALASTGAPTAVRAADPTAMPTFASIDLKKITDGYSKSPQLIDQMNDAAKQYQDVWDRQQAYNMLDLADQQQLGTLLAKPDGTLSADDQQTIQNLENKSNQDTQELTALQQKSTLTDGDKAQLDALIAEQKAGQDALSQVHDSYVDVIKAQQDKINDAFTDQVKAAIAAVAKDKGYTVVFDAATAVYCENDITDLVLARLNK